MTEHKSTKKTFSLPQYLADRLDEVSRNTGFSQSNLVHQALAAYLHRYEQDDTLESWQYWRGLQSGGAVDAQNIDKTDQDCAIDWYFQ